MANIPSPGRESFTSKFGVIAAAAGSAIGLGNIWRFPYVTGQNGGAAFLLIYLAFVTLGSSKPFGIGTISLATRVQIAS